MGAPAVPEVGERVAPDTAARALRAGLPRGAEGPRGHRATEPHRVLFPARNGSLRNPNNFGRSWRAARGENYYSWVTPQTFRRGVGTAVDNAYGDPERAARQLGNTKAVAKAHYIDIPETAPDNREVLERWARGERPKT
ncbi:hypothetical protein [Nocardia sp. NPDC004123]